MALYRHLTPQPLLVHFAAELAAANTRPHRGSFTEYPRLLLATQLQQVPKPLSMASVRSSAMRVQLLQRTMADVERERMELSMYTTSAVIFGCVRYGVVF